MGYLQSLDEAIAEHGPHTAAHATCEHCGCMWIAHYPWGTEELECPACHLKTDVPARIAEGVRSDSGMVYISNSEGVFIDGVRIPVTALHLDMRGGKPPALTLEVRPEKLSLELPVTSVKFEEAQ